jgi:hypothetical protein
MTAFIVVSDEQPSAQTLDEYGLRFDIEETFLDAQIGWIPDPPQQTRNT